MTATKTMAALQRLVPPHVRAQVLRFAPIEGTGASLWYQCVVPEAGTLLGIHLPREWPRTTTLLTCQWDRGEDVVVPSNGFCPARAAGKLRYWTATKRGLRICLGAAAVSGFDWRLAARDPELVPCTLLVAAVQSGVQKTIATWGQGGGPA